MKVNSANHASTYIGCLLVAVILAATMGRGLAGQSMPIRTDSMSLAIDAGDLAAVQQALRIADREDLHIAPAGGIGGTYQMPRIIRACNRYNAVRLSAAAPERASRRKIAHLLVARAVCSRSTRARMGGRLLEIAKELRFDDLVQSLAAYGIKAGGKSAAANGHATGQADDSLQRWAVDDAPSNGGFD